MRVLKYGVLVMVVALVICAPNGRSAVDLRAGTEVWLEPASINVKAGDQFEVGVVVVTKRSDLGGVVICVKYDLKAVEYINSALVVTGGTQQWEAMVTNSMNPGEIEITVTKIGRVSETLGGGGNLRLDCGRVVFEAQRAMASNIVCDSLVGKVYVPDIVGDKVIFVALTGGTWGQARISIAARQAGDPPPVIIPPPTTATSPSPPQGITVTPASGQSNPSGNDGGGGGCFVKMLTADVEAIHPRKGGGDDK